MTRPHDGGSGAVRPVRDARRVWIARVFQFLAGEPSRMVIWHPPLGEFNLFPSLWEKVIVRVP